MTYDGWTYTWEEGRQLKTASGNGHSISYKYDDSGIRTQKVVDGVTTNYHLVGNKVTYEDNGTDKIYCSYDSSGNLLSMNLNGTEYYYIRNAQGDIIGLFDSAGTQVVSYTYDTWGKMVSTTGSLASTVGVKNPYRYRGYRYDTETQLYYLQSRYYNPEWGRFINVDSVGVLSGLAEIVTKYSSAINVELLYTNLFAYCANNAVNNSDPNGFGTIKITLTRDFLRDCFKADCTIAATGITGFIVYCQPELATFFKIMVTCIAGCLTTVLSGVISRNKIVSNRYYSLTRWWLPNRSYTF